MTVLEGGRLEEAHSREIPRPYSSVEVQQIVLMVSRTAISDFGQRSGTGMSPVESRSPVVKKGVVRNVVLCGDSIHGIGRTPGATRSAVGIDNGQIETTHERSPSHAYRAQQIADVLAAHRDLISSGIRTNISDGIGIANHR